jgi:hypothetical protein
VKLDNRLVKRHDEIFNPPGSEEQKKRHERDFETTWLEYTKEGNKYFLDYTNRLLDVIQEDQTKSWEERFPHLVSFVGQTGGFFSSLFVLGQLGRANHYMHNRSWEEHTHPLADRTTAGPGGQPQNTPDPRARPYQRQHPYNR